MIINLAFFKEIATHLSGARNDQLGKGFPFLNRDLGLIYNLKPDEIYHLGAQSHVRVSFDMPEFTGDITGLGTTRILEEIRRSGIKTRFYQASSSEMFGSAPPPQNEETPF